MAVAVTNPTNLGGTGNVFIKTGLFSPGLQATGGVAVTPATFGLSRIDSLMFAAGEGYVSFYKASTGKVITYQSAGSAAAMADVGATDLSAIVFPFIAIGQG